MNISLQALSLVFGCVVGVLAFFTTRHPVVTLMAAVIATMLTEGILRIQNGE